MVSKCESVMKKMKQRKSGQKRKKVSTFDEI